MFAEKYVFNLQMMFRLVTSVVLICLTLAQQSSANDGYGGGDGGYGGGGGYEAPPPKTKFNIGFNLPAMSISLPKLELPQISIKASVKNKKPFTLKMPIIKFNAHASTEEEYGGGDYGGGQPQGYGEADGGANPSAYASSGNGVSGYANSGPEMPAYAASAANPKVGYPRPAPGQYNEAPAQPQSYASASGYNNPAPDQNQNTPYASGPQVYSRQIQQAAPQEQSYAAQNIHSPTHGYTSQAHQTFTPQHNYQIQPQPLPQMHAPRPVQHSAVGPVYQVTPAVTANGYHVPRPAQSANQVPEYKDENVKFYGTAPVYQSAPLNPSSGSGPVIEEFYGGARLQPSRYGRRSTRNPYLENVGGVFLASASDQNGPFILTPFNDRMDLIQWNPLIRQ